MYFGGYVIKSEEVIPSLVMVVIKCIFIHGLAQRNIILISVEGTALRI